MIARLSRLAFQLLVAVDQLAQVTIVGTFYLAGLADACPSARDTISGYVGRAQIRGLRWARLVAPAIDRLFILLGSAPGHCRRVAANRDAAGSFTS